MTLQALAELLGPPGQGVRLLLMHGSVPTCCQPAPSLPIPAGRPQLQVADFGLSFRLDANETHVSNAFQVSASACPHRGWPPDSRSTPPHSRPCTAPSRPLYLCLGPVCPVKRLEEGVISPTGGYPTVCSWTPTRRRRGSHAMPFHAARGPVEGTAAATGQASSLGHAWIAGMLAAGPRSVPCHTCCQRCSLVVVDGLWSQGTLTHMAPETLMNGHISRMSGVCIAHANARACVRAAAIVALYPPWPCP